MTDAYSCVQESIAATKRVREIGGEGGIRTLDGAINPIAQQAVSKRSRDWEKPATGPGWRQPTTEF